MESIRQEKAAEREESMKKASVTPSMGISTKPHVLPGKGIQARHQAFLKPSAEVPSSVQKQPQPKVPAQTKVGKETGVSGEKSGSSVKELRKKFRESGKK